MNNSFIICHVYNHVGLVYYLCIPAGKVNSESTNYLCKIPFVNKQKVEYPQYTEKLHPKNLIQSSMQQVIAIMLQEYTKLTLYS